MITKAPNIFMLLLIIFLSGCGTEDLPEQVDNDYYPMDVGHTWTYEETTVAGITSILKYEVTDKITMTFDHGVGEKEVFVLTNTFPESITTEYRIQYLEDTTDTVTRLQHLIYMDTDELTKKRDFVPGFLRFDRTKTSRNQTWTEELTRYTDTMDGTPVEEENVTYSYNIVSTNETVTLVDGKVINNCMQIERTNMLNSEVKTYYFAPGIGKVKEITTGSNADKTELLTELPNFY